MKSSNNIIIILLLILLLIIMIKLLIDNKKCCNKENFGAGPGMPGMTRMPEPTPKSGFNCMGIGSNGVFYPRLPDFTGKTKADIMNYFTSDCKAGTLPFSYSISDGTSDTVTKQEFINSKYPSRTPISFDVEIGNKPNIKNYLETYSSCGGNSDSASPTNPNPNKFHVYYTLG
jgi:hypothetical protein